jgi:DNA-binding SARP family transcriptional activator
MMDFRLLGPLEVRDGDRLVRIGGGKRRALLAILLLHANEVISRERLIDELWDGRPSGSAEKAVHVYVSELRKAFASSLDDVLVTRGSSYMLRVADELDVRRFEHLVEAGREALESGDPRSAAEKLRAALVLWRGPPLADFTYASFAQAEIARLEELRLVALELRIQAELALGRSADVVGELEALAAEHPLRERLRGQQMLALYLSGRQAEALEAYQRTRRALVDELGIEPSRELQELERRILRHDPELDIGADEGSAARIAGMRTAPAGRQAAGMFVGREPELAQLEAGLADALGGRGRMFLLAGPPGIGKSRLADEVASRAKERGAHVLWARCWEAGGAPAYWPWVQLIRSYRRTADRDRFEPGLSELVAELAGAPPTASDEERFRLFDATAAFLLRAAECAPLAVVLDDLHAADTPSLLLLRFFADEVAEARILIVGTYRDSEPELDRERSAGLVELARHGAVRLTLRGLDEAGVAAFIEQATGSAPREGLAAALRERTGGNPLLVRDAVR